MAKMVVTPWEVSGEIDYEKLLKEFGTQKITDSLLSRLKKHTKDLHFMLTRRVFFSHRDFDWILDEYEKGNKFFLYTGRGPSEQIHLGHLLPFILTRWLQEKFKTNLYVQLTDDEKFLFKQNLTLEKTKRLAHENILDIIALGFRPQNTKFLVDTEHIKTLYPLALKVAKKLTFSTAKAVFGFTNENNIGQIFYTALQSAPCFLEKKPCLIPLGIDQDPHFRITRDIAPRLGYPKPALLHTIMLPSLQGESKMSASAETSAIYTTDGPDEVERKIMKYAFSGGQETIAEHRKHGGNSSVDVAFQYLKILFEPDNNRLKKIHDDYKSGQMLTGELKQILIEKINNFLKEHQKKREKARNRIGDFLFKE